MKPIRYLDPHRQSVREQGDLDAIFVQAQHRVLRHVRHYSSVMAIILRHAFLLTGRVYVNSLRDIATCDLDQGHASELKNNSESETAA